MANKHALLSASSSHRWLACPPSARLCSQIKDQTTQFAAQGTDAHELCQHKVEKALGRDSPDPTENLSYYDQEMENCAEGYCSFVMEQVAEAHKHCNDPLVLIEQRLDFSQWVPEGFGTGDCVIVADDLLQVIDYKHGVGVLVEAEKNPQMMCYALGAYAAFSHLYDIQTIRMTIYQPRRDNVSTYETSVEELLSWAKEVLQPTAALAYNGEGEFTAGEHCRFCAVKATCRKRAEYNLELAKYDFEPPAELEEYEIDDILTKVDKLTSWVSDVKEYALNQALQGVEYEHFKVVEGNSKRRYTSEEKVAKAVAAAGYDPYEKKLLGITAMTSLLGKKRFSELLGNLVYKPEGKPTLAPRSDTRPEMKNTAKNDFKE